jgi:hypothetical protein
LIEQSESIANLAASLSKAQAAIEGAVKGKVNPAFKSKYADLASVWDACREALTDNGLSVVQSPGHLHEGRMEMTTMLLHASGEWMRGSLSIPLGKVDAHGYGSATTYARRFALAAFVGVAPEDDDGNAAAKSRPAATLAGPVETGRKSAAQCKKDGDDVKIRADISGLNYAGLTDWKANFDSYTAHVPLSWADSINDMLIARLEELDGEARVKADAAEMDNAYRGTA